MAVVQLYVQFMPANSPGFVVSKKFCKVIYICD